MKAIKFFAITAMAAAMITSCSTDDELSQSNYPSDNIIRVTAGVNNAKTRADGKGTEMKNDFSLTIVNKNTESTLPSKYTYIDKVFSKKSGDWACSETLLWQNDKTPVDIVAFAPAQTGKFSGVCAEGSIQPITYSVADDQSTSSVNNDLLYYYAPGFVPGGTNLDEKGRLSIQFNHAFCMIDINVTLGTEFNKPNVLDDSPIVKVTLDGTKIAANVDVKNAATGSTTTTASVVTASETATPTTITTTKGSFTKAANAEANAKSCFSCIAIPQKVAANTFKVSLMTAGKRYEWTSDKEITLQSGYRYTLELTMGNNVVLLKGGGISATPWGPGTGGSLETE